MEIWTRPPILAWIFELDFEYRQTERVTFFLTLPAMWPSMWFLAMFCFVNPRLQMWHRNGQTPLCTKRWLLRSPGVGNVLLHTSHLWGFSLKDKNNKCSGAKFIFFLYPIICDYRNNFALFCVIYNQMEQVLRHGTDLQFCKLPHAHAIKLSWSGSSAPNINTSAVSALHGKAWRLQKQETDCDRMAKINIISEEVMTHVQKRRLNHSTLSQAYMQSSLFLVLSCPLILKVVWANRYE